jgi:hypothetical protein
VEHRQGQEGRGLTGHLPGYGRRRLEGSGDRSQAAAGASSMPTRPSLTPPAGRTIPTTSRMRRRTSARIPIRRRCRACRGWSRRLTPVQEGQQGVLEHVPVGSAHLPLRSAQACLLRVRAADLAAQSQARLPRVGVGPDPPAGSAQGCAPIQAARLGQLDQRRHRQRLRTRRLLHHHRLTQPESHPDIGESGLTPSRTPGS